MLNTAHPANHEQIFTSFSPKRAEAKKFSLQGLSPPPIPHFYASQLSKYQNVSNLSPRQRKKRLNASEGFSSKKNLLKNSSSSLDLFNPNKVHCARGLENLLNNGAQFSHPLTKNFSPEALERRVNYAKLMILQKMVEPLETKKKGLKYTLATNRMARYQKLKGLNNGYKDILVNSIQQKINDGWDIKRNAKFIRNTGINEKVKSPRSIMSDISQRNIENKQNESRCKDNISNNISTNHTKRFSPLTSPKTLCKKHSPQDTTLQNKSQKTTKNISDFNGETNNSNANLLNMNKKLSQQKLAEVCEFQKPKLRPSCTLELSNMSNNNKSLRKYSSRLILFTKKADYELNDKINRFYKMNPLNHQNFYKLNRVSKEIDCVSDLLEGKNPNAPITEKIIGLFKEKHVELKKVLMSAPQSPNQTLKYFFFWLFIKNSEVNEENENMMKTVRENGYNEMNETCRKWKEKYEMPMKYAKNFDEFVKECEN